MRRTFSKLIAPALVAAALVAAAAVPAWAYFTASDYASGTLPVKGVSTNIKEYYGEGVKEVVVHNNEDSVPVWVRARAYSASELQVEITADGWTDAGDGWYNYNQILQPGEDADDKPLVCKITWPFHPDDVADDGTVVTTGTGSDTPGEDSGTSEVTVSTARGTNYNIVVVYEAQPVKYDADNNPIDPVWPYQPAKGGE